MPKAGTAVFRDGTTLLDAPTLFRGLATLTPPEAIRRLVAVRDALPSCGDPEVLAALARALPERVGDLTPEVSLALQEITLALRWHRPRLPTDVLALEPRLRTLWLRVRSSAGDDTALPALDDTTLLHLVTGWSHDDLPTPMALLRRLSTASDARLRSVVLRCLEPLVQNLAITGEDAFACLDLLTADPELAIRIEALQFLGAVWLMGLVPASIRRRESRLETALRDPYLPVMRAAVSSAAALGMRRWLVDLLVEAPSLSPRTEEVGAEARAFVITALAPIAEAEDIDLVLRLGAEDPLRFGPSVRYFLLESHRHGVFVRERHLDAVLDLFDAHVDWTAEEIVRVTHIVRTAFVTKLGELSVDDPRWRRRALLLGASIHTGAHLLLGALLETASDPRIVTALVQAAGRAPEYDGEDRLLRWLDLAPEVVIPVLRVKGGARSELRLRAIVLDPFVTRGLRALAMDALWALTPNRSALLGELSAALGPHDSGLLDAKYLSTRDRTAAELLQARGWVPTPENAVDDEAQLGIFCESGDIRFLPEVTRLFRDVFRGYVRRALAGDFSIKRLLLPDLEQRVFRYGRHLVKDGRSVRRWLDDGPETGRDLVLLLVCDWLAESPSSAITVALLETAARHAPSGATLRFLEPFWRRSDPNVKRAAIEALLAAGDGARGLELSLGKLAGEASDPRILVQALAAIRTLRARWAEPTAIAALGRPEMAVKKEAAEALAEVGSRRSVVAIVGWLERHDNEAFRASLMRALQRAAGASMVAVLVLALEAATESRSRELLRQALNGHLRLAAVLRLAASEHPAHRDLIDACLEGTLKIADAKAGELAAHLHRARLRVVEQEPDPTRRLRLEGFSPEAAEELVAARTSRNDAQVLPVVRQSLADWLGWLATSTGARKDPLALVLDAADRLHPEHLDVLMGLVDVIAVEPAKVAAFFERCVAIAASSPSDRLRAIAIVRRLPHSAELGGLRRYRLLARLGALRTVADLDAAVDECRIRPDAAGETTTLLFEALAIPAARDDDPPALVTLRDEAKEIHRAEVVARRQWLATVTASRPIDLPPLPPPIQAPPRPAFKPRSREDLDALLAALSHGERQERLRAATFLLEWSDASGVWEQVLAAYLDRLVDLTPEQMSRVVGAMRSWPESPEENEVSWRSRRLALVPFLDALQVRALLPRWLDQWESGEEAAEELLHAVGQERLLPAIAARAASGSYRFARLLRPGAGPALRTLVAMVGAKAPAEVAHLLQAPEVPAEGNDGDPVDPIAGRSLDELLVLIAKKGLETGLAVRAVHALTTHAARAVLPLERLTTDRRPQIRSAALRAIRLVTTRERTLEVMADVLEMETRRDVVVQLMTSLGHGRHEPTLAALLERLTDRDVRIRQGAHAALRAWGRDVVPALRRASRRARPDRRALYDALLADLQ